MDQSHPQSTLGGGEGRESGRDPAVPYNSSKSFHRSFTVTAKVQLIGFHFVDGARLPLEEPYWPFISWG